MALGAVLQPSRLARRPQHAIKGRRWDYGAHFQCICSVRLLADRARVLEVHVPLRNSRIMHTNHPFVNRVVHCPLKCPSLTHTYIGSYCVSPPCLLSPNPQALSIATTAEQKVNGGSFHTLAAGVTYLCASAQMRGTRTV